MASNLETIAGYSATQETDMHRPVTLGSKKIQEQYPVLSAEASKVAVVSMGDLGVTNKHDGRPILATPQLHTCIGLLGYNMENGIGFF